MVVAGEEIVPIRVGNDQGVGTLLPEGIGRADECFAQPWNDEENTTVRRVEQEKGRSQATVGRNHVYTLGGPKMRFGVIPGQPAHHIHPGTRRIDNLPRADRELRAADSVHYAHAGDFSVALFEAHGLDIVGDARALKSRAEHNLQAEPGVVHLCVYVAGTAMQTRRS